MTHSTVSRLAQAAAVCLALSGGLLAHAQSTSSGTGTGTMGSNASDGYSILPYTRSGYVGLNIGRPDWEHGCAPGFGCGNPNASFHIYTGGLVNDMFGVEVGYLNAGRANRDGGRVRAQGLNLSLVARTPVSGFNVFGKLGTTYGETRVSASAPGVQTGTKRGWGLSYGVGVGYDFNPQTGVVLEWSRHDFRFPGGAKRDLDGLSLGVVHRF